MSGRLLRIGQALAFAAVAALLALLVWRVAAGEERGAADALDRGERVTAPALALERLDRDGTLTLESLRGKAVVVNFWASWCIPCKDEAPFLQETWERYRADGLVVLGVDAQDFREDARRFLRRYGVTYPVVYDGRGATLAAWGVIGFPETFFVDRSGQLVGERIQGGVDSERNREAFERGVALALGQGA
ncbi:MAG: TlpA family protein disulfide reductase [Thermoleophilia bacterium]|nr:TlpA family protein disulfide reductase [Thermoleophilia bacterium]